MVELTERARQIEKGYRNTSICLLTFNGIFFRKAKTRKSNIVHTGLGGGL